MQFNAHLFSIWITPYGLLMTLQSRPPWHSCSNAVVADQCNVKFPLRTQFVPYCTAIRKLNANGTSATRLAFSGWAVIGLNKRVWRVDCLFGSAWGHLLVCTMQIFVGRREIWALSVSEGVLPSPWRVRIRILFPLIWKLFLILARFPTWLIELELKMHYFCPKSDVQGWYTCQKRRIDLVLIWWWVIAVKHFLTFITFSMAIQYVIFIV